MMIYSWQPTYYYGGVLGRLHLMTTWEGWIFAFVRANFSDPGANRLGGICPNLQGLADGPIFVLP